MDSTKNEKGGSLVKWIIDFLNPYPRSGEDIGILLGFVLWILFWTFVFVKGFITLGLMPVMLLVSITPFAIYFGLCLLTYVQYKSGQFQIPQDKKGGRKQGLLKSAINCLIDFFNPTHGDLSAFLLGLGIEFLLYLRGSISLFWFVINIPLIYLSFRLISVVYYKFIWSKNPATKEALRTKKIFKFRIK